MSTLIFQLDALIRLFALCPPLKILKLNLVYPERSSKGLGLDGTGPPKPFYVISQQLRDFSIPWPQTTPPPQVFIWDIEISCDVLSGGCSERELRLRTDPIFLEQLAEEMVSSILRGAM